MKNLLTLLEFIGMRMVFYFLFRQIGLTMNDI